MTGSGKISALGLLRPFITPQRRSLLIAFTLMICEAAVELSYPLLMALLIDRGVLPRDLSQILVWGLVMAALALFSFACGISSTFFAADAGQRFARNLRSALFQRLSRASTAAFQRIPVPSMLTRLSSDVNQLQNAVFMIVRLYLRAPLIILGAVLLTLAVDLQFGLVLVLVTPVIASALVWTLRKGMRQFRLAQEQADRLGGLLRENINGMSLVRSYSRGAHEQTRFAIVAQALRRRAATAMQLSEMVVPGLILVLNLCILFILWRGNLRIDARSMEPGQVVAILNYATRIIGEFVYLSMILTNLGMARSALGRSGEILRLEVEALARRDGEENSVMQAPQVRFADLGFSYSGSARAVLRNVSFVVEAGQTAVVIGSTGSGKSSLLQLLLRLHEASEGRIMLDGRDLGEWSLSALRCRIGYVSQQAMLVSGTIRDNLRWGKPDATEDELAEATRRAQIHDLILSLRQGYDTVLEPHGGNLSGGQKQRLSIARALLRKPDLLLLDDCTSALDARTEAALLSSIGELACTTLLVTRKVAAARQADTVLLLDDGRLAVQGRHEDLLRHSALYRDIVDTQLRGAGAANRV
jgi:ATP-binding cassette subfamily B protein